jgi:hypothetical protein
MSYEFRGFRIPARMEEPLRLYILEGIPVGQFLTAVLCNNLREAIGHGDDENVANLPAFIGYLYNEAPATCWGSPEKHSAWIESHKNRTARVRLARPTSDGLPREDELTFGGAR